MRPTKAQVFIYMANELASLGTCLKKKVACILADKDYRLLAAGYNGQPRGDKHCDHEHPCLAYTKPDQSCWAIHAEQNALMQCSDPRLVYYAFITEAPCDKCMLLLKNTGCQYIVYPNAIDGSIVTMTLHGVDSRELR